MDILNINKITKSFKKKQILKEISFNVKEQEIVGFLGRNGSGKSTTLKCVAGLYRQDSGDIKVCGNDIEKERVKALECMGISIESPALYPNLTGREHFKMVGNWRDVKKDRINEMIEFTGLDRYVDERTSTYSMGMKMRLMLGISLLSKPKLLILDEPTNGLDPQGVFDLRNQMKKIREDGTAILFSSHQLDEVERIVDRVVIIDDGQVKYDGNIPDHIVSGLVYDFIIEEKDILKIDKEKYKIIEMKKQQDLQNIITYKFDSTVEFNKLIFELQAKDIDIMDIRKQAYNLEEFYKYISNGDKKGGDSHEKTL